MKICAIGLRGIPNVMGGIETHCEQLYPRLARLDGELDIVVIGRSRYAQAGRFGNVRVIPLWAPDRPKLETAIHTPLAILFARLFLHPCVIHLHGIGPGFFAPLARLLGFRVVGTYHGIDYLRPKFGPVGRWFLKTGEWMLATFANDLICVSSVIEEDLARRRPRINARTVTIRNGAPVIGGEEGGDELLESLGLTPGKYILCVGRIDPAKSFHDVVKAFEAAKASNPHPGDMKLAIVGDSMGSDDYAAGLKASAPDGVVFPGALPADRVHALYRNAALFVHPSALEGFPMVVLEALAADTPLIVSDIPPHLEVGLDRASYFPQGDVEALTAVLANDDYARLRCTRRAEILHDNDWDTVARRHDDVFRRHARPAPPPRLAGKRPLMEPAALDTPAD